MSALIHWLMRLFLLFALHLKHTISQLFLYSISMFRFLEKANSFHNYTGCIELQVCCNIEFYVIVSKMYLFGFEQPQLGLFFKSIQR